MALHSGNDVFMNVINMVASLPPTTYELQIDLRRRIASFSSSEREAIVYLPLCVYVYTRVVPSPSYSLFRISVLPRLFVSGTREFYH